MPPFKDFIEAITKNQTPQELDFSGQSPPLSELSPHSRDCMEFRDCHCFKYRKYDSNMPLPTLLRALVKNTSLKSLSLSRNVLHLEDFAISKAILTHNKTLTSLNIESTNLGEEGAKLIAEGLKNNSVLTSLNLGLNNLGAKEAQFICEALTANNSLKCLNLNKNNLGPEGAKYITEALTKNATITELFLENNNLLDDGIWMITTGALIDHRSLTKVSLSLNWFTDSDAARWTWTRSYQEYLKKHGKPDPEVIKNILILDKIECELNSDELKFIKMRFEKSQTIARCLADVLEYNSSLKFLGISGLIYDAEGLNYLLSALKKNKTLTELEIEDSHFGPKGMTSTKEIMACLDQQKAQ